LILPKLRDSLLESGSGLSKQFGSCESGWLLASCASDPETQVLLGLSVEQWS